MMMMMMMMIVFFLPNHVRARLSARWVHLHFGFLCELHRRLSAATGYVRQIALMFQRLSVVIQRYYSVFIYDTFGVLSL